MKKNAVICIIIMILSISCNRVSDKENIEVAKTITYKQVFDPKNENVLDEVEKIDSKNWNVYENKTIGFSIKYPKEWIVVDGEKYIYFGTKESAIGGYIFTIIIEDINNYQKIKNEILDGRPDRSEAVRYVKVNNDIIGLEQVVKRFNDKDWIYKAVFIQKEDKVIIINNGAKDIDEYTTFYRSIKI